MKGLGNMSKDILLSILILVSGKKKEVWKCLDSLKSLRKNVPSELILTDTHPFVDYTGEHAREGFKLYKRIQTT